MGTPPPGGSFDPSNMDEAGRPADDPTSRPGTSARAEGALPPLPIRLVQVFVSPGVLMDRLAATPRWAGALLVSAVVVGASLALIPPEVMVEAQRQAAMERGAQLPEMGDEAMRFLRVVIPVASGVSVAVFNLLFAGLYTVVFAFVLGDEGRYVQYLAAVSHAWFIAALFGLLVTPLRIATEDPQYTLNLASFFFFLPDGYLYNVLRALDLTQIWSTLVIAQGAHAIDARRSFRSAAAILLVILLCVAMVAANFM